MSVAGTTTLDIERPAPCHWQTLSYNVVSSTPRLARIRTHNDTK